VRTKPVRVAVHAEDALGRIGLADLLTVGSPDGIRLVEDRHDADVQVMSIESMSAVAFTVLRHHAADAGTPVVLICADLLEPELLAAVDCRVYAVLDRVTVTAELLVRAVEVVASGGGVLPPAMVGRLLDHVSRLRKDMVSQNVVTDSGLTAREIDVIRLLADGLVTEEIAKKLCFSERTVKNVIYGTMRRHGLRNRSHAVAYAMRCGLI
jgi:DNA-binding NarL/FixJ family response regulator